MSDVRDDYGHVIQEGDTVHFSYGIPPVGVDAPINLIDGKLYAMTPDHKPEKCLLSQLKKYVGNIYKIREA